MYNFKLKSFLGSVIVLGGLLLSACNGGGGNNDPKPLSSYNSIREFTVESELSVDIKDNQINVVMLYGTNFAESRNVTFTTTGKYVTLNNVEQNSNGTLNTFESGGTVDYIEYAENGESQTYKVTLIRSAPFVGYPNGCVGEACACLQDTTTGDVWTRTTTSSNYQCYNSLMSESGTCTAETEPSKKGYIPNLNETEMCGFKDNGWNLPSEAQLRTMSAYVSGVSDGERGTWFNEHGFSEIKDDGIYLGQCSRGATNCKLPSGDIGGVWLINLSNDYVLDAYQNYSNRFMYGWGVHSRQ